MPIGELLVGLGRRAEADWGAHCAGRRPWLAQGNPRALPREARGDGRGERGRGGAEGVVWRSHPFAHARRPRPDAYGVLVMPDASPLHILLELDRGTEAGKVLREKAARYAEILPRSGLRDLDPFVVLAVPSARRAETARAATASGTVPIGVRIWNRQTTRSVLAIVRDCAPDARSQ